jgi:hypothetical protein
MATALRICPVSVLCTPAELIHISCFYICSRCASFVEAFLLRRSCSDFTIHDSQNGRFISQARAVAQDFSCPILGFPISTRASSDSLACSGGECACTLATRYQR